MEIKEIKQLIKLMVDHDLTELNVTDGDTKVLLKRGPGDMPVITAMPAAAVASAAAPAASAPAGGDAAPAKPAENLLEIKSPMVGTFYSAPSPDSEPYVQVGAAIGPESVTCIVEAMKVMNEIKAECSGTVVEVCVKNAQPVEFGQVLFKVKP